MCALDDPKPAPRAPPMRAPRTVAVLICNGYEKKDLGWEKWRSVKSVTGRRRAVEARSVGGGDEASCA